MLLWLFLSTSSCKTHEASEASEELSVSVAFVTGAEVLGRDEFKVLQGKTVGLVVNHTARIDTVHLADALLQAPGVDVGALFSPEHGIRGDADAGAEISDGIDKKTGVPVYSLYGKQRRPTAASLEGLDALVYDIQDVGARFYTYTTTMGFVMQAAAEAGIPFYVLDRPNPLGGDYVAGYTRKEGFESFVSMYPVPAAFGLTPGEFARMIKGEGFLEGLETLDLNVIKMEGWERSMTWDDLDRSWRAPSPNIPDFETALVYAGTCLFEAVAASEGRGTYEPFKQLGAPWVDREELVASMNGYNLPGVSFAAHSFTPRSIDGMSSNPRFKDEPVEGIRLKVSDIDAYDPVATGVYLVHAFYQQVPENEKDDFINDRWMGLLSGSDSLQKHLEGGSTPAEIVQSWQQDVSNFLAQRAPYLLYD